MIRFIKKSIIIKAAVFSIFLVIFYTVMLIVFKNKIINEVSINILYANTLGLIFLILGIFLFYVAKPLEKISYEVKALLI